MLQKSQLIDSSRASSPKTPIELIEYATHYSTTINLPIDFSTINWVISTRATKRAACCKFISGKPTITISLTWAAFNKYGWEKFQGVVRHELIHVWEYQSFGVTSHGIRFKNKAIELDAPIHCEEFSPARFNLKCKNLDCYWSATRHRASKTVTHPLKNYRCHVCGSPYEVEHISTSTVWETHSEYLKARKLIGSNW